MFQDSIFDYVYACLLAPGGCRVTYDRVVFVWFRRLYSLGGRSFRGRESEFEFQFSTSERESSSVNL